ncbi:MAG: zinc dependent phospholipase C family protein [Candidatus Sericytochromatia bacterium]
MKKLKLLALSLTLITSFTSCDQGSQNQTSTLQDSIVLSQSNNSSIPYSKLFSSSILETIKTPTEDPNPNDILPKDEFTHEYVDHFRFFNDIDVSGSSIEEVLEHDGYTNAQKYVVFWRKTLSDNMDWPDHESTTYKGPFPAMEHGLTRKGKGWFGLKNAKQKAEEYYSRALNAWKKGVPATDPQQKEAWEWLGRTAHFIQDSTVPHHSMVLLRFDQLTHHPYEKNSSKNFSNYFPSKNYNPGTWNNGGPYPQQGQWGIYSNKNAGEVVENNLNIANGLFKTVNHKEDEANGNCDKSRSLMLPLAVKTCSGLIVNFLERVGEKP